MIVEGSDPAATTPFFLPGTPPRRQELEYDRLLQCAQRATGSTPVDVRIHRLGCRLGGRDCTIEVGELDPIDGEQVVAIVDLGRGLPYGVFTTADPDSPALRVGKHVYAVTRFRQAAGRRR